MSKPQQTLSVDQKTSSGDVQWYRRGCASFDKRTGGLQKSRLGGMRAVMISADRLWEPGQVRPPFSTISNRKMIVFQTITATFVSPRGTATQQEKVKKVVQEWYKYANLNFNFVTNRNATIRIAFEEDEGSWSYVGRDNESIPKSQSTMNYGWVETGKNLTVEDKSVILHEFGHCIGLLHEHQSSRRGEKITLDEAGKLTVRPYLQLGLTSLQPSLSTTCVPRDGPKKMSASKLSMSTLTLK